MTLNAVYYPSTSDGGITEAAPSGQGNIKQKFGRAMSPTKLMVRISDEITVNP